MIQRSKPAYVYQLSLSVSITQSEKGEKQKE
jgi:hypothetical protein